MFRQIEKTKEEIDNIKNNLDVSVGIADISFRIIKYRPAALFKKIHFIPSTLHDIATKVFMNVDIFPWHKILNHDMFRIDEGTIALSRYLHGSNDGDISIYSCSGDEYRNVLTILDGVCGENITDVELLPCKGDDFYEYMYYAADSITIKFIKQLHNYRNTMVEEYSYDNLEARPNGKLYIFYAKYPLYALTPGDSLRDC